MDWGAARDAIASWVRTASGLVVHWAERGPRPPAPYVSMRVTGTRSPGDDWTDQEANYQVLADDVVESVDAAANTLTLTAHAYLTGDGPLRLTTSGTLPGGLALLTDYWAVKVDADKVKLATSFQRAAATVPIVVDVTSAGTGTHTILDTTTTQRAGQEMQKFARGHRSAQLQLQCFADPSLTAADSAAPYVVLERVKLRSTLPSVLNALDAGGISLGEFGEVLVIDGSLGDSLFEPRAVLEVPLLFADEVSEFGSFVEFAEVTVNADGADVASTWVPSDPPE
jgi:hypothetical protein